MKVSRMAMVLALVGVVLPGTGSAQETAAGYSGHYMSKLFAERPCTDAVRTLEGRAPEGELVPAPKLLGDMAMAFGYLLGLESAFGDLSGPAETTMKRLIADCSQNQDRPARDILMQYIAETR